MTSDSPKRKTFENIIKQSDVLNQLVFDATTMEEVGRIDVLWMYPQINRVLGFVCKSGFLGSKKAAFKLPQLKSIGDDSILVTGEGEPTVAAKVKQLESLVQSEVWTDDGEKIGSIIDCLFNYRSGVIVRYLMIPGRLASITNGVYFLPPKAIQSFGQNRVLISAEAAKSLKPYRKGWKYKLAELRDTVKEDYVDGVSGELQSFAQQMQVFSKDALGKVGQWGDRLRDETQSWVEQAKERGQALFEKAKASGQTIFDRIRTEGLSFDDYIQGATARTQSDESQRVTFPRDEENADESTEDYDRDDWDDDWNDWEDAQDQGIQVDDSAAESPEDDWGDDAEWSSDNEFEEDWGDEAPATTEDKSQESAEGVTSGEDLEGNGDEDQESSSEPPINTATQQTTSDIWDDDWVDDLSLDNSEETDDDQGPISSENTQPPTLEDDGTDPWI
ncbi:MAG: hypothetical protein AAFR31_11710 [Cyanobacteria bacterium J06627_8]